ncbi:MAG: hypothetical protein COA47_01410 [Robiginitomaculum sp.]|nr:MAG: hypothetical protein COA47_01410 [Robiginitomaculum sp.]
MSQPADTPPKRNKVIDLVIIVVLMGIGGAALVSKVGRNEPVRFSDQQIQASDRVLLKTAEQNLALATPISLLQARDGFAEILGRYPEFPPAIGQMALSRALILHLRLAPSPNGWALVARESRSVLQTFPNQKDALLAAAWAAFYDENKPDQANQMAQSAQKQQRYNPLALVLQANIADAKGKPKLAIRFSETLALQEPNAMWLRLTGCRLHVKYSQWERAASSCKWAAKPEPSHPEATELLAIAKANLPKR